MIDFYSSGPVLRFKQKALDIQDLCGLLKVHWHIGRYTLLCSIYTRVDQMFVLWGVSTALMFGIAQFFPFSWTDQAIAWSLLTALATGLMVSLIWFWASVEQLRWLVYGWSGLMIVGTVVTDYGIFRGNGPILLNLCPLWLGLSALGYLATGLGMRSRTFLFLGICHLLAIPCLALASHWQFLITGMVMSGSLFLLAEIQWDMRPPIESTLLTVEQQAFNREQHRLRQLS